MPVSTDCRAAVIAALSNTERGLTLDALMTQLRACHPSQAVCDELHDAVKSGSVVLAYRDEPLECDALLFKRAPESHSESVLSNDINQAVDAIVKVLASRTDNRGDDDPIMHPAVLLRTLASKHDAVVLEAALRVAFNEGLLYLVARPSNRYVTVTLSQHHVYTVLTYDHVEQQAQVFHVRGANEDVVLRKLAAAWPQLQRLALAPGRLPLRAADPQLPLPPHTL